MNPKETWRKEIYSLNMESPQKKAPLNDVNRLQAMNPLKSGLHPNVNLDYEYESI